MSDRKVTIMYGKFMYAIVILFFIVVIFKLAYVTFSVEVNGVNIKEYASSRNTSKQILYASRGDILDINGDVLASTINSYTLIAYLEESRTVSEDNIRHVVDVTGTSKALSEILSMDYDKLLATLSKDKYQVEIVSELSELKKREIEDLGLDGIGFSETLARYYPSGTFASYIVGYAKKNDDLKIVGELGVEGYYNDQLTGTNGSYVYQKDGQGYKIPHAPEYTDASVDGNDIYLTIDSGIQLIVENAIGKLDEESAWGIFAVMDANTGAIVASATNPTFNPNDLNTIENNYLNPLVSYQFEPGSTMKTFSFGVAIEEGIYNGSDTFTSGYLTVADKIVKDHNNSGWGDITYDTGYAYSSNVATSLLALEIGSGKLTDYYLDLGFGDKTGIELSNEVRGEIDFMYDIELANAAFGQGISVTPIQMLQAYTTITNNGTMLKPYIIDKIVSGDEIIYEGGVESVRNVFSKDTVSYLQKLMSDAVYNSTSSNYIPNNINILGKSGTAQIAEGGVYLTGDTNYTRSFMSIFPADEPHYIMYAAVNKYEQSGSNFGNIVTTAIEEIASYANIVDQSIHNQVVNEKFLLDNYISKSADTTTAILEYENLDVFVIGDGTYITNQYPYKGTNVFDGDKIFLKTNSDIITMMDLTGFSYSDVVSITKLMGIKVKINGTGFVTKQSVPAGNIIEFDDILELNLS